MLTAVGGINRGASSGIPFPPLLFACNALASGHKPAFPQKGGSQKRMLAGYRVLAPLHFWDSLFQAAANLWPGGKSGARQKHRREENFPRRPPPCIRRMRRAWRSPPPGAPRRFRPCPSERMARPPGPGGDVRLMVLARAALASGPGTVLEFDSSWAYLAQSEGGRGADRLCQGNP